MTYLQPRSKNRSVSTTLITILVILIVVVSVQYFFPQIYPNLFAAVARPFWRVEFAVESGALNSAETLMAKNEELKRQLAGVDVRLQMIQILEQENTELKAMLGRASTTPRLLAAVLKRPPFAPYDELIIDIGADFNLATGTAVYASEHVRIGTIVDVLRQTAKVKLLSSPGEKFEVLIGSRREPAIAVGRGGGQYEAEVPHEAPIAEGDAVIAPSLDGTLMGVITAKISDPSEPFDKVLFAPNLNVYSLRWVLIDRPR